MTSRDLVLLGGDYSPLGAGSQSASIGGADTPRPQCIGQERRSVSAHCSDFPPLLVDHGNTPPWGSRGRDLPALASAPPQRSSARRGAPAFRNVLPRWAFLGPMTASERYAELANYYGQTKLQARDDFSRHLLQSLEETYRVLAEGAALRERSSKVQRRPEKPASAKGA
jgi:hypothetical protein